MEFLAYQPKLLFDGGDGAAAASGHLFQCDFVLIAPSDEPAKVFGERIQTRLQMIQANDDQLRRLSASKLELALQQVGRVSRMVIRHAPQTRQFGSQLKSSDREQPCVESRSRRVFPQTRVSRDEGPLRHFIDVDAGTDMPRQPCSQRPFEPADDDLERGSLPVTRTPNGVLKLRIAGAGMISHYITMAVPEERFRLCGRNSFIFLRIPGGVAGLVDSPTHYRRDDTMSLRTSNRGQFVGHDSDGVGAEVYGVRPYLWPSLDPTEVSEFHGHCSPTDGSTSVVTGSRSFCSRSLLSRFLFVAPGPTIGAMNLGWSAKGISMLGKRRAIAGFAVVALAILLVITRLASRTSEIAPLSSQRVLFSAKDEGSNYSLADDGNLYRHLENGSWTFHDQLFDPEEVERSYQTEGKSVYRVAPDTGKRYPVRRHFTEDFEGVATKADGLRELIGPVRQWTDFTLQSPLAPSVEKYVALRKDILTGGGDFLDARVEPSREKSHGGQQSLKCFCPAKSKSMICTKASLGTGLIYFKKGDSLWHRGWYYIAGAVRPHTLVDIECDLVKNYPGIRLMLFQNGDLGAELKAATKPKYRQAELHRIPIPTERWVEVSWYVLLDDGMDGRVRIWQDDTLVVDASGQTLPYRTAIYNRMEVGISAHSFGNEASTLYVDDIVLTSEPLRVEPAAN